MIVSIEKAKAFLGINIDTLELVDKILALELLIRRRTNNNFQNRNIRGYGYIEEDGKIYVSTKGFKVGDTIQISNSKFNGGLYTIKEKSEFYLCVDKELESESQVLVAKVEYPLDVQDGALKILRWQIKNEKQNYKVNSSKDDYEANSNKEIQSETISRYSVTYVKNKSENALDEDFGVPIIYLGFLKPHKKMRKPGFEL